MAPTEPPVSTRVGDSSWSSRHPLAAQVVHVGLGVPALALGVALASLTVLQSRFHDEAVAAYGLSVHVPSLDAVCRLVGAGQDDFCTAEDALLLIVPLAIVSIVVAIAVAILTHIAARRGAGDTQRLARLFGPILIATIVIAVALGIADAALIFVAVWYGEPALLEVRHLWPPALAVISAIAAMSALVGATIRLPRVTHDVIGVAVTRSEAPRAWAEVDKLARALGVGTPDNVVLGLTPEFYVTEAAVKAGSTVLAGRTLYLSLPLSATLSADELRAVIGHELGHFTGGDLAVSARFYPIYARASQGLATLAGASRASFVSRLTLRSAYGTLLFFLTSFAATERAMARPREIAADRVGATLVNPGAIASALVKIVALTPTSAALLASLPSRGVAEPPIASLGEALRSDGPGVARAVSAEVLDSARIPHPTDSHPPLSERLLALGTTIEAVVAAGLVSDSMDTGWDLIDDAGERDRAMTAEIVDRFAASANARQRFVTGRARTPVEDEAWRGPAVRRVVEFVRAKRDGSLTWLPLPRVKWLALDDLELGPHPDASPYRPLVQREPEPSQERRLVQDVADEQTPDADVLEADTELRLVGVVVRGAALVVEELVFVAQGGTQQGRTVAVRVIGTSPIGAAIAGTLIAPSTDALAADEPSQDELAELVSAALDELDARASSEAV